MSKDTFPIKYNKYKNFMAEEGLPEICPFPNGLWNILADSFIGYLKEIIHCSIRERNSYHLYS